MLSTHGVQFEHLNVWEDETAAAFLSSHGISSVPVVVIDEEIIVGLDEERLKRALGLLETESTRRLGWVAEQNDSVFFALMRAVGQLSPDQLDVFFPQRNMTLREHALHIVAVSEGGYLSAQRGSYASIKV